MPSVAEVEAWLSSKVLYFLTSHGSNGHGGYPRGGGSTMFNAGSTNTRELTNFACTNVAATGAFSGVAESGAPTENTTVATDKFDDIVLTKYRADLE